MCENDCSSVDMPRIEKAVREILLAVGEDPGREGLRKTPGRVARMYAELLGGARQDTKRHVASVFHEDYDEIVLLVGEGSFVATLCKVRKGDVAYAQTDIFRLQHGLIVEHWANSEVVIPEEQRVNSGQF